MSLPVHKLRTLTVISLVWTLLACSEAARVRGGISTTRKQLEQTEQNGAYECAPKELALAKAHIRFAELEIEQGRGTRARYHFDIARRNAQLANEKSPADKCAGPAVTVQCSDSDGDSICDNADLCIDTPEDFDGIDDQDGCPEDQDIDGDGINDKDDQCLLDSEDVDNYLDDDGCPDIDNDFDKILDNRDHCVNEPEDPDGFQDDDGCPDTDNDKDNILDIDDECPNMPGEVENNGCPKKYDGVEITETHIRIKQKIHFAYNKARIKKTSYWILSQVSQVLADYPEISLSIEGHTDSRGSNSYNRKLSQKRAKAVMNHLIKRGKIDRSRLTSNGWGESKPIETNLTDEGRAANRRVEFVRTDVSQEAQP
jgi:OOP family OmpA-OmpF porin